MSVKSFWLGALFGLAFAWAPGCSSSKCSPSNCNTCCDINGVCLAAPQNSTNNACGTGGAICAFCSNGENCTQGRCQVPKKVGDSCDIDADCQALGATAVCKKMTTTGQGTYLSGYCTLLCKQDPHICPEGSACFEPSTRYGESDVICWDLCSIVDECRSPGYACYQIKGVSNACWINPLPFDAGPPADKVGDPCSMDSECQNPPAAGGICLLDGFNDVWPQGYCSKLNCNTHEECAADAGAMCFNFGDSFACAQRCIPTTDGGSPVSSCRAGYQCYPSDLADGGVEGHCSPEPRPVLTTVGDPCTTSATCQSPYRATASCLSSLQSDGGPTGWTDGYCTRFQCHNAFDCSQDGGGECLARQGSFSSCFRTCPNPGIGQSTCRDGYACFAIVSGDAGAAVAGICDRACDAPGGPECPEGQTCDVSTGYCKD